MPNTFAYLMLAIWPLVSVALFKRLSALQAVFWTICGGYMILPEETLFNLPLIPTLDKESVATLAALAGCYFIAKERVPLLPRTGLEKALVIIILVTPFITTLTNQEPIRGISGMSFYDAFAFIMGSYIGIIPFLLGLYLVRTYNDQLTVFRCLVIAGLIYSLPALFEVRMSPQLHSTVYGFFPHEWRQQIRFGGFRPVVFMKHGLVVATFFATALMAAISLWRDKQGFFGNTNQTSGFTLVAAIYLILTLVLCKSVGAIFYGSVFLIATTLMPQAATRLAAVSIISIVITYPLLCLMGIFPHQTLVNLATNINDLRAQSLAFRFFNEDILLTHTKEKLLFGWGLWGRNRPFAGVVIDGYWISMLSTVGLVSFLARFGLPAIAIFRGLRNTRFRTREGSGKGMAFYALLIALIMVDQLVNATISSYLWFLVGGLLGRANHALNADTTIESREPIAAATSFPSKPSGLNEYSS